MLLFILYADFESIVKPVDERYREKMNRMKAGRKRRAPYAEKNEQTYTVRMVCAQYLCLWRCTRPFENVPR